MDTHNLLYKIIMVIMGLCTIIYTSFNGINSIPLITNSHGQFFTMVYALGVMGFQVILTLVFMREIMEK